MITIKESKKRLFKIKGMTIFDKYLAYNIVCEIHDSVGTCQTCKKQATRDCPMVFFNQETYETVDHSRYHGFCSEFERKQND